MQQRATAPEAALFQKGKALQRELEHEAALAAFDAAWRARPGYAAPLVAKAMLLAALRRFGEARIAIDAAIEAKPHYAEARYVKGELLLLMGEMRGGWDLFESRLAMRSHRDDPRTQGIPRWTGEPIAGASLLVESEIGLGDFLMFARYLPTVQQRVGQVVIASRGPLVRLLAESFPGCVVVPRAADLPPADFRCSVMSLPSVLGEAGGGVPQQVPYLRVPQHARAKWEGLVETARAVPRVGLAWYSRSDREMDLDPMRCRQIPPGAIAPLLEAPVQFHSLQREPLADARLPVIDHSRHIDDLADTAALAQRMDLVISIDTAQAHLAGALGLPLWVALPFASDYRWGQGDTTVWYPSARLVRQHVPGRWDPVVRDLVSMLRSRFA
jgi:hypothetical protein